MWSATVVFIIKFFMTPFQPYILVLNFTVEHVKIGWWLFSINPGDLM